MRSAQARNAEYKRRKAKCTQLNLCLRCQQPKGECKTLCRTCLNKKNAVRQIRRQVRQAQGLCLCGSPVQPGSKECQKCQADGRREMQKRRTQFRIQGKCFCGADPDPGKTTCASCDQKATAATLNRYHSNIASERCAFCGGELDSSSFRCNQCLVEHTNRSRIYWQRDREIVISHYGSRCICCGESQFEFLDIDHVRNNGSLHRKIVGQHMCSWIIENNYPTDLQLLCSNCNHGKAKFGVCPHITAPSESLSDSGRQRRNRRLRIISQYGGQCTCCGEDHWAFLEFDHINDDGAAHRLIVPWHKLPQWIIKNNYPDVIQLLCSNCNKAKGLYGICPHKALRIAIQIDPASIDQPG
jgi:hypothetical protein